MFVEDNLVNKIYNNNENLLMTVSKCRVVHVGEQTFTQLLYFKSCHKYAWCGILPCNRLMSAINLLHATDI